jgi:hypothetical protein
MLVHAVLIAIGLEDAIQASLAAGISDVTGVAGSSSQLQFVVSSETTFMWVGYLVAIALNLVVLIGKALLNVGPAKPTPSNESSDDAGDLWESQK